jgi:hypothetical protein
MSDPAAAPPVVPPEAPPKPRRRGWFVVLAWITLVGFVVFTGGITILSMRIPELRRQAPR